MLDLVLLDDIVFVDGFHGEEFLRVFLLDQQNCPEGSLSKDYLRHKIVNSDLFLEIIPGVKCLGSFSDHLLFLLFPFKILLEGHIIMKYEISFNILDALLLLFLLSGGIVDQVQFLPIVNRQFLSCGDSERLKEEIDDLIPSISRRISA